MVGRGESRFRLDGGGWSDERKPRSMVEGEEVAVMANGRRVTARGEGRAGEGKPGNGKGGWVGARVCLNRDLRNLSLEFPVKD